MLTIEEGDKTCIEPVLHAINNFVISEWVTSTACQVILITDGNPGVGHMSLTESLSSLNMTKNAKTFPLPFSFPGKLSVMCIAAESGIYLLKF